MNFAMKKKKWVWLRGVAICWVAPPGDDSPALPLQYTQLSAHTSYDYKNNTNMNKEKNINTITINMKI